MTSSNGNFSVLISLGEGNPSVTGEFPSQRLVTRSFDVFFDQRLNKQWWSDTPSRSFVRHWNDYFWWDVIPYPNFNDGLGELPLMFGMDG